MDGAGAAETHAAAELRSSEPHHVSQVPEQWHLGITVELALGAVDFESDHFKVLKIPTAYSKQCSRISADHAAQAGNGIAGAFPFQIIWRNRKPKRNCCVLTH
jgi:hypothetical protein